MDTTQASVENIEENNVEKVQNGETNADKSHVEVSVTQEQVLGATGVRKRRTITRKRTSSLTRPREQTPVRDLTDKVASSDEEVVETRPKTPERRRRKISRKSSNLSEKVINITNTNDTQTNEESANGSSSVEKKAEISNINLHNDKTNSIDTISNFTDKYYDSNSNLTPQISEISPKEEQTSDMYNEKQKLADSTKVIEPTEYTEESVVSKLENIVNVSQTEFIAMLDKAKQTIKSGRERYNRIKTSAIKRSQSAPRELTDEQTLQNFRRAQEHSALREIERVRANSLRKYSSDSVKSTSSLEEKVITPVKPSRRQVSKPPEIKRKPLKHQTRSNKIVEILDPKTSKVIKTKEIINITLEWRDFLIVMKYFTVKDIIIQYKKFKADMKDEYNKIVYLRRKCFCEFLLMMVLCGLGGVIFKFVEGAFENFYKCGVKRVKRDFIDLLWIKSHNLREEDWKSLARNKLRVFEEELHIAHEAGVHTYAGQRSWSFLNGVFYSLTVVTAIGYGHLYPSTPLGQGLTILYALIGIPLFLIILTDFGKLFTRCIKYVWAFFRRLCYTGRCRKVRRTTHVEEIFKGAQIVYDIATLRRPSMFDPNANVEDTEAGTVTPGTPAPSNFEIDDQFNLPISLALSILVMYILLGAVAFQLLEGWTFFTSFYFVFISMSTIGFGDYVPKDHTFMIFSIIYLVFGLALMSMCINVVQDKLSDTFKQASAKIGATLGVAVNDEDGSIATVPPDTVEMPEVHKPDTSSVQTLPNAV